MKPARMAYLYRGHHWCHFEFSRRENFSSVDRFCTFQSDLLARVQVFDANNRLLLDRIFHPLLDEVTHG